VRIVAPDREAPDLTLAAVVVEPEQPVVNELGERRPLSEAVAARLGERARRRFTLDGALQVAFEPLQDR
jgi:hypothetical protein